MTKYDVVVLGAGPGGYTLAGILSSNGLKVAVVEKEDLGGTCVNKGCISTKTLIKSAKVLDTVKNAEKYGVQAHLQGFDFATMQGRRTSNKELLNGAIENFLKGANVDILRGEGKLVDAHSLMVNDTKVSFDKLVVATGSKNRTLTVKGAQEGYQSGFLIDSEQALKLTEVPKRLVIIGSGAISLEFAYFYSTLGSKVTILSNTKFLSNFDSMAAAAVAGSLKANGVEIIEEANISEVRKSEVVFKTGEQTHILAADKVLVAIGRVANLSGLDALGLKLNAKGFVDVCEHMKTNISNVYALGDVTGLMMLSTVAYKTADVIAKDILKFKDNETLMLNHVPWAIYLNPELAGVGKTAAQLTAECVEFDEVVVPAKALPRLHADGQANDLGFIKFLVSKTDGQILGCFMFVEGGHILINQVAFAMHQKVTFKQLQESIYTHPTIAEALYYSSRNVVFKK
ncbi:dihydrolipoamide dehydrogenase [Mycoplasmopsis mustelae]|uniref:Dihydrolipoamide dehydrogenase n=1 Tax=Mycoplasmopsis mustelae TaxID=171289 RepID=A0A4V3FNV3_9BACT|nr:dihydrolipoyl dehydrogenase [Mycoplasmopsis mustelae]TDV23549.1 dihydrolipoamide dehydrogenase [Mycoplasmopsis mustelae]